MIPTAGGTTPEGNPQGREDCPELARIIEMIAQENPLQKKRIEGFLNTRGPEYWSFAEGLSQVLNHSFITSDAARAEAARAYNKMCMDFLSEQIRFKKTGKYRIENSAEAVTHVYNDLDVMRYYMVGLLVSYMFWPNHYELFRFFLNNLPDGSIDRYLEVGVGHGLFSSTMLSTYPDVAGICIDISETSIKTAKETLKTFQADPDRLTFIHGDYLTTEIAAARDAGGFPFIIMGEVLEHVNDAKAFMDRTKDLLAPGGTVYMSTCANCPALDHVYHFHSAQEIRDLMAASGFRIVDEFAGAAENIPEEDWEKELVTVNYCALLEHA